jgi:hypothetical protein
MISNCELLKERDKRLMQPDTDDLAQRLGTDKQS